METKEARQDMQTQEQNGGGWHLRLAKFLAGALCIAALAALLGSGWTLPGTLGTVVRHNQDWQVDATALIYSDLENMDQLESDLAATLAEQKALAGAR